MLETEDIQYLEEKFTNVYKKIDSMYNRVVEQMEKEMDKHADNLCPNIVGHTEKLHKNTTVQLVIIVSVLVGIILGVLEIVKSIRH